MEDSVVFAFPGYLGDITGCLVTLCCKYISLDPGARPISFWLGKDGVTHATFNDSFGFGKK